MAFRFRRTIKIAPGLRLNIGKKNVSLRAGVRGLGITAGTAGKTFGAGIPGTGLHYRQKLDSPKPAGEEEAVPEPVTPPRRSGFVRFLGWTAATVAVLLVLAAIA